MSSWQQVLDERITSPAAREGYAKARAAHEFGARVRELREGRGMSQSDLAREPGTTQPAVARMEAGGVDPRLSTVQRVSAVFDASFTLKDGGVQVAG